MKLMTQRGAIDLNKVVFVSTYRGSVAANSDGIQVELYDPIDQMLVQYFFADPLLDAEKIIALADAIKAMRQIPAAIEIQTRGGDESLPNSK